MNTYAVRINYEMITCLSVTSWHVKLRSSHLLVISSSVIISVCTRVFDQLSNYCSPTLGYFFFFFSFAGLSERQESKPGERSQREQKQRKGTKQRQGAPFNCEPDGGTRQSHPAEEERDRRGRRVSLHKHTHTLGEGLVINRRRRGRKDKRSWDYRKSDRGKIMESAGRHETRRKDLSSVD